MMAAECQRRLDSFDTRQVGDYAAARRSMISSA
jgi:hypothetical protein